MSNSKAKRNQLFRCFRWMFACVFVLMMLLEVAIEKIVHPEYYNHGIIALTHAFVSMGFFCGYIWDNQLLTKSDRIQIKIAPIIIPLLIAVSSVFDDIEGLPNLYYMVFGLGGLAVCYILFFLGRAFSRSYASETVDS